MTELATTTEDKSPSGRRSDEVLPVAPEGIEWTKTSLRVVDPEMTYERMEEIVGQLRGFRDATSWWLGDALRFSEAAWGEKYAQMMDVTGLGLSRLTNIVYVCEHVEQAQRRDDLSFTHHELVASLEQDSQIEWLTAAAESAWPKERLREALKEAKVAQKPARTKPDPGAAAASATAAATVDSARHLVTLTETLDLLTDALEGVDDDRDAQQIIAELEAKLPQAREALEQMSEPVRNALADELAGVAREVVKHATVSGGFYMVPTAVFEPFKAAVPTN